MIRLTRSRQRNASLCSILVALCATFFCGAAAHAQSAHSALTGIDVPRVTLHPQDKAVTDTAQQQLTQIAGQAPKISRVEVFMWTGELYKPEDSDSLMQSVEQALRKGGYVYDVNQRKQSGDTSLTTFLAIRQMPKLTVVGVWLKGSDKLVLMWGQMGGDTAAPTVVPTPTEAILRGMGARPVEDANIPTPLREQVTAAANGTNLPIRSVQMMMLQPTDYKRSAAPGQIARVIKALEKAGYTCPPQQSQKSDAMDMTGFAVLNAAKTQGAAGFWLATDKSLMLLWAEIGGGKADSGGDSALPGKMRRQIQAQNPTMFSEDKVPAPIRERLLAYAAQQNRQCNVLHLAVCKSADYQRGQAGKLIQKILEGIKSAAVAYVSEDLPQSAQGDVTLFSLTEVGHKDGVAGVWVATNDGLIVVWSDTTPKPQSQPTP